MGIGGFPDISKMTKCPRVLYGCILVVDILLLVLTKLRGGKIKRLVCVMIPI